MNIIVTCRMGPGTFEAKLEPIIRTGLVNKIYVVRKSAYKPIRGIEFILLPKLCRYGIANLIITPFALVYYAIKLECDLILSYHIIPHAFFAFVAGTITGTPYIVGQTGLHIQKYVSRHILLKHAVLVVMKHALQVNVPGSASLKYWVSHGVTQNKVIRLHSTIDTDYFIPSNDDKCFDFVFLGRLAPEKRVEKIIVAFSLLRESYCPELSMFINLMRNELSYNGDTVLNSNHKCDLLSLKYWTLRQIDKFGVV